MNSTIIKADDTTPSGKALKRAAAMGRRAAKADAWMHPCPEEHLDEGDDLGTISEAHRDAWCSTTHFDLTYGDKLTALTDEEAIRLTGDIGGLDHIDLGRYEGLYIPLRDAFFEAWEEATGFHEKAQRAIEEARSGGR